MALTIYTLWANRIIAGTHTFKQVPKGFAPTVRQILESQRYHINPNGSVIKRSKLKTDGGTPP